MPRNSKQQSEDDEETNNADVSMAENEQTDDAETDALDPSALEEADTDQEAQTPKKRRGRPKKRLTRQGSEANFTTKAVDETEGSEEEMVDSRGEEKITKDGVLLGGRRFKCESFRLPRHSTRNYVFALDIARILGYRDTHALFQKHPELRRVIPTYDDRDALLDKKLINVKSKNRPFSLLTARSAFKFFGHKVIYKGKPIRDDYHVGDKSEPEYGPEDDDSENDEDVLNNAIETNGGSSGAGKQVTAADFAYLAAQRGLNVNDPVFKELKELKTASFTAPRPRTGNWLPKVYQSASEFNAMITKNRRPKFFDIHTGMDQVPKSTQPNTIHVLAVKDSVGKVEDLKIVGGVKRKRREEENGASEENKDKEKEEDTQLSSVDVNGNAEWVDLTPDAEDNKYPLALVEGQYQGRFSIYNDRFQNPDAPPILPGPLYTVPPVFPSGDSVQLAPAQPRPQPTAAPTSTAPTSSAPVSYPFPTDPRYTYFCGAPTRDGQPCRRPVSTAGEKCLYHKDKF